MVDTHSKQLVRLLAGRQGLISEKRKKKDSQLATITSI